MPGLPAWHESREALFSSHGTHCTAERAGVIAGGGRKSFQGGADNRGTSREDESPRRRPRSDIRLMGAVSTDARSHPMLPCAAIALLVSVREDILRLIRLWALLGA